MDLSIWLPEMTGVFLGALLGAFAGYKANERAGREDAKKRRRLLLTILRKQLADFPLSREWDERAKKIEADFEVALPTVLPLQTLPRNVIHQLLTSDLFDPVHDEKLIETILSLDHWTSRQETTLNLATTVAKSPNSDETLRLMSVGVLNGLRIIVVQASDQIDEELNRPKARSHL